MCSVTTFRFYFKSFCLTCLTSFLRHKYPLLRFANCSSSSRMFKRVTQSVANQMDPGGDLVPVHSILDHEHFRPLCLVRKKRKAIFQPCCRYKQTGFRLEDVLLPGGDHKSTGKALICHS